MPVRSFADANVFHRAIRTMAVTKAGRLLFRPTAHRLDQLVSKLTGGKRSFAGIAGGLPAVILTTTGAKSGKPRTVALLGIPHPDGVAVVATNYGAAKHPAWYHNLKANPAATVTIEGDTWDATAASPHPASATRSGRRASKSSPASPRSRRGPATATSRPSSSSDPEEHAAAS
jgi:deazaflavin-dependent oxidoreductase (nitroreductase family)